MVREPEPPVRVLHVFGAMDRGGAETRTLEIMRRLDPHRVRFDFCVLSGRAGAYAAEIEALGGRVIGCPLPGALLRLPGVLRRGGWNVVHSHVHHFSGAVLLAAWHAGVPRRVAHLRTSATDVAAPWSRRAYTTGMRRLIDATATHVLAVSEAAMEAFYGTQWHADPRRVVRYNGVEPARFQTPFDRDAVRRALSVAPHEHLLLHVGNFHPAKNHDMLLAVAARLADRAVPFVLALAGDGPGRPTIERAIAQRGLSRMVRVLGSRNDVADLLRAADCFVLPSLWEGLPGALLEALAAGVPVVASAIAPVQEIARHAAHVTCVAPGDVDGFSAAVLCHLLERPRTRLPRQFTLDAALDGLLECYA